MRIWREGGREGRVGWTDRWLEGGRKEENFEMLQHKIRLIFGFERCAGW